MFFVSIHMMNINHICGVMVSVLTLSVIDHGFEPGRDKPKTIKLIFVVSPHINSIKSHQRLSNIFMNSHQFQ